MDISHDLKQKGNAKDAISIYLSFKELVNTAESR